MFSMSYGIFVDMKLTTVNEIMSGCLFLLSNTSHRTLVLRPDLYCFYAISTVPK